MAAAVIGDMLDYLAHPARQVPGAGGPPSQQRIDPSEQDIEGKRPEYDVDPEVHQVVERGALLGVDDGDHRAVRTVCPKRPHERCARKIGKVRVEDDEGGPGRRQQVKPMDRRAGGRDDEAALERDRQGRPHGPGASDHEELLERCRGDGPGLPELELHGTLQCLDFGAILRPLTSRQFVKCGVDFVCFHRIPCLMR